ncbi:MAG: helix-turn-helix domain-containing protein [Sphaerochaetaceae bacterium]|nr:helix-turn-helix domain-containing protein [Sphaerochaetaceae bacterium]
MFHKALSIKMLEGTTVEVKFQDGKIKQYDMKVLFEKYPQLKHLNDRTLFTSGKLESPYGIVWNDDLDIETETIYQEGKTVGVEYVPLHYASASAVSEARAQYGISQKELAEATGIDQGDISRIERGISNPSVETLERIAKALGKNLEIKIK